MEPTAADLTELKRILAFGSTPDIEGVLKAEIVRLSQLFPEPAADGAPAPPAAAPARAPPKPTVPRRVYEGISSYAFSDSSEAAKIIISDIEGLSGATIEFTPTERAFSISVLRDGQGLSNLRLTVDPLKKIVPSASRYVVRGRTLTVILSKKKKAWTKLKNTTSAIKKPKPKEDPNTALMDMMKKMYEEGDDMKRTMQKA
jgi:hypothetical protein